MNPTLTSALWITLIGMGLVFIALLLLWGLMALMVNLTSPRAAAENTVESGENQTRPETAVETNLVRQKAAAAAVAVALALGTRKNGHHMVQQDTQPFSAWQSVLRGNQLNQHSRMYSRKQRGTEQ